MATRDSTPLASAIALLEQALALEKSRRKENQRLKKLVAEFMTRTKKTRVSGRHSIAVEEPPAFWE